MADSCLLVSFLIFYSVTFEIVALVGPDRHQSVGMSKRLVLGVRACRRRSSGDASWKTKEKLVFRYSSLESRTKSRTGDRVQKKSRKKGGYGNSSNLSGVVRERLWLKVEIVQPYRGAPCSPPQIKPLAGCVSHKLVSMSYRGDNGETLHLLHHRQQRNQRQHLASLGLSFL